MPEEEIIAPEKEEQTPKTLEEFFVLEYLKNKNELKSAKEELGSAKKALAVVVKELKLLKAIVAKYTDPIEIADDGHVVGGSISMYISAGHWDLKNNPGLREDIAYLKTIIPVVEKEEEEEEEEEKEGEESSDGKKD